MKASNLQKALLALRYGVFIVMFVWTIDKFINPAHTSRVFAKYYFIDNLGFSLSYVIGTLQLILVLCFVAGIKKKISYGSIFIMHAISTLSSYAMYFEGKLLFFAAWPMLAAIYALFILRDEDTLFTFKRVNK